MTADTSLMPANTSTTRPWSRRASRPVRCAALALVALAAAAVAPASAIAGPATYAGSSANGSLAFFTTTQKLVPGDTDNRRDVYARLFDNTLGTYITRLLSFGPTGGNDAYDVTHDGASADGTKVFFSTAESLVAGDTDRRVDIYMRDLTNGTTTLVSQGSSVCAPTCGNGNFDAFFTGATPDGSKVFFITSEQLSPQDTDNSPDIYVRDLTTDTTTLVSQGDPSCAPCGNGPQAVSFRGASSDGTKVFFTSTQQFASGDTDSSLGSIDIYERDLTAGTTTLVSPSGTCPSGNDCNAIYAGASSDGSHVFFETNEQLSTDTDSASDVYDWSNGTATLVSTGPNGDNNGSHPATFVGASADGTKVFFQTSESLVPGDTDTSTDIYMRDLTAGTTTLVSQADSSCARPTCGNDAFDATYNGASADGTKVFFSTKESLVPQDTDTSTDIYMRDLTAGTTTLETPGGICPLGGGCDASFDGVSTDGAHVFFSTFERLTTDDIDSESDVYERAGGATRLVSVGNSNSVHLGPATPILTGTAPASPGSSTTPAILGQADQNTSIKIYATPDCSGATVATGTSAQLTSPGIGVTVAAGSTTTFHATATDANGDTSACSSDAVNYQQVAGAGGGGGGTGGGSAPSGPTPTNRYVEPQVRITFAPASKTRIRRPVFRFIDATGQAGTTFLCKVDSRVWQSCNSPTRLKRLKRGKHTFQIIGTNAVGAQEPAAVTRSFKVVRG